MRFTFPNGEHPGVELGRGSLSIGADAQDTICLPEAGLKPGHVRIELQPERKLFLLRLAPGALAYVNARPVRKLALLRAGDTVMLNRVRLHLVGAVASANDTSTPARNGGPRIVLRSVAGAAFGRSFGFGPSLSLGRSARSDIVVDEDGVLPMHARLHWQGDRCLVLGEQGAQFEVNGHTVAAAQLLPGDQLRVGGGRFVLEAPGLRVGRREDPHTPVKPSRGITQVGLDGKTLSAAARAATAAAGQEAAGSPGFNYAWLILAATAVAGALIALFLFAPAP
ncbi:MAG: FHA domain-containing protein [Aquimonas sp.]|nr:FHA domain-containing protein [Aquimonas sp.]